MSSFPVADPKISWCVALPDNASTESIAARLTEHATREIPHTSGRPWLLGHWPVDNVAIATAGENALAVIGEHAETEHTLASVARRTRTPGDLDGFAASLNGSVHLLASYAGVQRLQGTILGVRRMFRSRVDGVTVAADRADVLAWLAETGIDEERLALHLIAPIAPHPLGGKPVWREVEEIPGGCYLAVHPDGTERLISWWYPPEPTLSLTEGADRLRTALVAAMDARIKDDSTISCELGGLDSTSLCGIAAGKASKLTAVTVSNMDTADDDLVWARRTVAGLGNVLHEVLPDADMPLRYHGLHDATERFDEPCLFVADRSRLMRLFRWAAEHGSARHFGGFGGDELLSGSPSWLTSYGWTDPRRALLNLRGYRARGGWPLRSALSQVLDPRPYAKWLASTANRLTETAPVREPRFAWGPSAELAPWVTRETVAALGARIRAEARSAQPLSRYKGMHGDLEMSGGGARIFRHYRQIAGHAGVFMSAPYFDDRVVTAGLSVRPHERVTPWRYKPLIIEAMRGIVPSETLRRTTKADGTAGAEIGLSEHREELLELFEDSRLADLGLIDRTAVLEHCRRPPEDGAKFFYLIYHAIACEIWLRTVSPRG